MASGLNRVTLIGRLGKNPEIRSFESGKNARFTLATNEDYKNKSGEKITHTEWHNISLWRGLADIAEAYLKMGDLVYLEGRLRNRSYEQEGVKKYFTEIECDNMVMLGGNNMQQQDNKTNVAQPEPTPEQIFSPNTSEDDDLPF